MRSCPDNSSLLFVHTLPKNGQNRPLAAADIMVMKKCANGGHTVCLCWAHSVPTVGTLYNFGDVFQPVW